VTDIASSPRSSFWESFWSIEGIESLVRGLRFLRFAPDVEFCIQENEHMKKDADHYAFLDRVQIVIELQGESVKGYLVS